MTVCCPCDELKHPAKPDIPAGQSALPRQLAGFPEYRLAMLRDIPTYAPLAQWRAREGDDLGIMLLEMWAYALDILGFYDERIANENYLRTAVLRPSLRKLVGLIGYQARPALAASVVLAAIADGNRPVKLPPQTGFRSDAFNGEPPQVFETGVEDVIHPLKNEWTLGPVRDRFPASTGEILLEPATARLSRDQLVLFRWKRRLPVFNGVLELSAGSLGSFSVKSDGLPFIVPIVKDTPSSVQGRILEGLAKLTFQPQRVVIVPLDPRSPSPCLPKSKS